MAGKWTMTAARKAYYKSKKKGRAKASAAFKKSYTSFLKGGFGKKTARFYGMQNARDASKAGRKMHKTFTKAVKRRLSRKGWALTDYEISRRDTLR